MPPGVAIDFVMEQGVERAAARSAIYKAAAARLKVRIPTKGLGSLRLRSAKTAAESLVRNLENDNVVDASSNLRFIQDWSGYLGATASSTNKWWVAFRTEAEKIISLCKSVRDI